MSLEQLETWLRAQNDELIKMHTWIAVNERALALAYRVLKEKMLR
jgi:hypothetical protein